MPSDKNKQETTPMITRARNREYDSFTKGRIIGRFEAGMSLGTIARDLDMPKSSVQYVVEKFKKTGTVDNAIRPGRPKIESEKSSSSVNDSQCEEIYDW
ncbi:hypothetical protein BDB01DRAFT_905717 [Pilobolus umbonatus]|nr:hypothetical protein BDB01DRAFT_905717 [Pilobolus umbonatus]